VSTSMGFLALDGLMMGTRSGALDPGVLLYLLEHEGLTVARLGRMLYRESGLAGVSGLSSELPVLLANEDRTDSIGAHVRDALALYVRRNVREVGALIAVLGGLDLLVFTAGVGENSAAIRARVCHGLTSMGIGIDDAGQSGARAAVVNVRKPGGGGRRADQRRVDRGAGGGASAVAWSVQHGKSRRNRQARMMVVHQRPASVQETHGDSIIHSRPEPRLAHTVRLGYA